jgi:hypothetical protein
LHFQIYSLLDSAAGTGAQTQGKETKEIARQPFTETTWGNAAPDGKNLQNSS